MIFFKKFFLVVILFGGIIACQNFYDRSKAQLPKPSPYVPAETVVRAADLGLHSAASSLYWLASIQYVGDWQSDNYKRLSDYLELSTRLDSKFSHPYAFGALVLPAYNQSEAAIKLGKRGIDEAEPNWEIPYYLGTAYHMYFNDSANAAKYFDIAARTPGAPDNIAWIAANYGSRPDLRDQTILIWQSIYENSKDPELKKRAEIYLYHFGLMNFLEEASARYKSKFGTFPNPVDKLVEGKILSEIPPDPFGYRFEIDENGRARAKFDQRQP